MHYTGTGGGAFAGPTGGLYESYTSVYNYLTTHASPGDTTFTSLPNTSTISGASLVAVWDAQLRLLGISPTDSTDGSATFATDISSSLMVGVALHEFTHALGRIPFSDSNTPVRPDIFDFFRFTGVGTRLISEAIPSAAAAFSLNGDVTKWADYGVSSDPSDFLNNTLTPEDSFNEFYDNGTLQTLTPLDLEQLDALGFHLKNNTPAVNSYDFMGDGNGDVLLQNGSGQIAFANMLGGTFQNWGNLANTPGYTVKGQGKISGGLASDVVIENSNKQILYGNVVNGTVASWVTVATTPGYDVVGVGDINDDHYADIVVQNPSNGSIVYASMHSGVFSGWNAVGSTPGWTVDGIADVNGDGFADIVIQNQSSGAINYGNMANGVLNGWVNVASAPGYNIVGAGDINRDGYADIVVQNPTTSAILYANMKNGAFNGWVGVGSTPGYNVIAVDDVIGNGYADIVVDNPTTGQIVYADMTTGTRQSWVGVAGAPGYTGAANGPAGSSVSSSNAPTSFAFNDVGLGSDTVAGFDPTRDMVAPSNSAAADPATTGNSIAAGTPIVLDPNRSILSGDVASGSLRLT